MKNNNIHTQKFWSHPIRVECSERFQHITTRTAGSRLWFVNNKKLEERILAFLGFYQEKYTVELISFKLMGNHYHLIARFPNKNRAHFMRDFNARIAEAVRILVPTYDHSGSFWQKRYSCQALVTDDAVVEKFIYSALQPLTSGLCPEISWYSSRCFLKSALSGKVERFRFLDYRAYNAARRKNRTVRKADFYRSYEVHYSRLPGMKDLSQKQYSKKIKDLVEERKSEILDSHQGKWMTKSQLAKVVSGSKPGITKKSQRQPLALGECRLALRDWFDWYFSIVERFREASLQLRKGLVGVIFPEGTYNPGALEPT